MAEFKDMLKYFRERENLSQKELAEKLGISASTISMYEVGSRQPNFEMEEAIADFFNVDLNTLRGKQVPEDNETLQSLMNAYMHNDFLRSITNEEAQMIKDIRMSKQAYNLETFTDKELQLAMRLYDLYAQAPPEIQAAVETLLKATKPDS